MEHLTFILSGFGVVMLVLAALWLTTAVVGRAFAAVEARSGAAPAPAPAAAAPVFEGVPPQHVAAISAAVAVLTGGRGRVVSVSAPPHRAAAWAHQGRSEQFASRRVRRDWARPGPTQSSSKGDR